MNLSKAPPNPLSLRHQTALVQTRHMCVLLQPGISLPVSSQHSWQLLNAIPKTAWFQTKQFKLSSEPLQRKIEGDMHESVPNSLEDDLRGLCEEGVKENFAGTSQKHKPPEKDGNQREEKCRKKVMESAMRMVNVFSQRVNCKAQEGSFLPKWNIGLKI